MAERVNAEIADQMTAQLLRVQRVATGLRRDAWAVLALLEADILALLKMSDPTDETLLRARRRAIEALMEEDLDPLIRRRYGGLAALLTAALVRLARHEAGIVQGIVNGATGEATLPELPSEDRLRRGVTETLIPTPQRPTDLSATGAEWWERQAQSLSQRIRDSLLVGVSLEESLPQLATRVKGTSDNGFEDGIMARARTDAATVVQTQVTNAVGEAHVAVGQRNASAALMAVHSSVLDSHTCLSPETLIKTPNGCLPINNIEPGMLVFGGSGEQRRVLATHVSSTLKLARITFSDGTVVSCTPDHQFLTQDSGWVEAQQLKEKTILIRKDVV